MSDKKKDSKEEVDESKGKFTVVTNMRDYSNDPFVIKKAEAARKTITKYGLPKELLNG